jgi:hypothetical protein
MVRDMESLGHSDKMRRDSKGKIFRYEAPDAFRCFGFAVDDDEGSPGLAALDTFPSSLHREPRRARRGVEYLRESGPIGKGLGRRSGRLVVILLKSRRRVNLADIRSLGWRLTAWRAAISTSTNRASHRYRRLYCASRDEIADRFAELDRLVRSNPAATRRQTRRRMPARDGNPSLELTVRKKRGEKIIDPSDVAGIAGERYDR